MVDLHVKYRPKTLKGIIGQDEVVRALHRLDHSSGDTPHAFLFAGPSGVGKTTIARIIASNLEAEVIEIDGATSTGIDAARAMVDPLKYRPIVEGSGNKCVILDECHALSKQAWQSLLKVVEEPPPHVYFCFCTTELHKVLPTIRTRCHLFELRPVAPRLIEELLYRIEKKEKREVPDGGVEYIARYCYGSVRQAIVYWTLCAGASSMDHVKKLVTGAMEGADAITLYRILASGRAKWSQCALVIKKMEGKDPVGYEGLRIGLVNYIAAALMKEPKQEPALHLLALLENFSYQYNKSTERPDFILALATCLIGR